MGSKLVVTTDARGKLCPSPSCNLLSYIHRYKNVDKQYLLEKSLVWVGRVWSQPKSPFPPHLPLDGLQIVQERPEAAAAFKHHGAEAPVVHSDGVGLRLKQLWGLRGEQ